MADRTLNRWLRMFFITSTLAAQCFLARAETDFCSASYVVDKVKGEETIDQYGSNYQAVNIFAFDFGGDCRVVAKSPWVEEAAGRWSHDSKRLILIDLVNEIEPTPGPCRDLAPGDMLYQLLSDSTKRADLIQQIVGISALGQGVEIDFEHVLSNTTTFLTQFMKELRAALPSEKKLAEVVQPKTGHGEQGTPVDWRAIEPYVDYLRVEAYYYSYNTSAPGPVITYAKLGELADYITSSAQSISSAKARILLSLYGWDWPISPSAPGQLIRYEEAMAIAQAKGITPHRDPVEDTLHFQYTDDKGVTHEVWVDDFTGVSKRVQLLMDKNFPAIDLWHLNTGDPALWPWFTSRVRTDCPSLVGTPPGAASAAIDSLSVTTVKAGASDTAVTLHGSGFTSSDLVLWDGNPYKPTSASADSLQVTILSADLQEARSVEVTVAQNGKLSNTKDFYVVGEPVVSGFDPLAVPAGIAQDFTLTVKGDGFEPGSQVLWEGKTVPTEFVSGQELQANISAPLLALPDAVKVGVLNPTTAARASRDFMVEVSTMVSAAFRVGPNPWTAGKNSGGINFIGVAQGSEVNIYSISGRLVRRVEPTGNLAEWDLTNDGGEKVSSGQYFYTATAASGGRQRGRVTVIR